MLLITVKEAFDIVILIQDLVFLLNLIALWIQFTVNNIDSRVSKFYIMKHYKKNYMIQILSS